MRDAGNGTGAAALSLGLNDLEDFVRGAAFLGCGGGGDPYVGRLILQRELAGRNIQILNLDDIPDDAFVLPVAMMGAPMVMTEKVPSMRAFETAVRLSAQRFGRPVDALVPLEIGGINATMPMALGARLGLPVVNADGMGRAFPEIQMVTFGIYGGNIAPVLVVDERGNVVTVDSATNKEGEDLARTAVVRMGGAGHIALYPMIGRQLKKTAIPDTLTLARDIGRTIRTARERRLRSEDALFKLLERLPVPRQARILFDGKITDVRREMKEGFNVGSVAMQPVGKEGTFRIEFQNENLIAFRDG